MNGWCTPVSVNQFYGIAEVGEGLLAAVQIECLQLVEGVAGIVIIWSEILRDQRGEQFLEGCVWRRGGGDDDLGGLVFRPDEGVTGVDKALGLLAVWLHDEGDGGVVDGAGVDGGNDEGGMWVVVGGVAEGVDQVDLIGAAYIGQVGPADEVVTIACPADEQEPQHGRSHDKRPFQPHKLSHQPARQRPKTNGGQQVDGGQGGHIACGIGGGAGDKRGADPDAKPEQQKGVGWLSPAPDGDNETGYEENGRYPIQNRPTRNVVGQKLVAIARPDEGQQCF